MTELDNITELIAAQSEDTLRGRLGTLADLGAWFTKIYRERDTLRARVGELENAHAIEHGKWDEQHAAQHVVNTNLAKERDRYKAALENIRHNSEYDMNKAHTNHDRGRFEIIWNAARQALGADKERG